MQCCTLSAVMHRWLGSRMSAQIMLCFDKHMRSEYG